MQYNIHIKLTAPLEHIDKLENMNVCCMGVCGCLPDNARILFLALCYIIAALYSFIWIVLRIAILISVCV